MDGTGGYWLTRFLLQRGLGVIHLFGFLNVVNQFRPLLGEKGLLCDPAFVRRVRFRHAPGIFHLFPNDRAFALFGWVGVSLSALSVTGLSEQFGTQASMAVWALLWGLYLSYVNIGLTFYGFGWESLLLESGFLAIFLGDADTEPSVIIIWLMRWVLFRVMLGAGLIKVRGDSGWRDLTCLNYHFETQPMPNPLSWYFHWLPRGVHKGGVLFNHLVELAVPFAYFAPQPVAAIAGVLTILFQGALIVSGNFSWLNHLTLVLAFSTFDDSQLRVLISLEPPAMAPPSAVLEGAVLGVTILVALLSIRPVRNLLSRNQVMNTTYDPLHLLNSYGAFGSVTRPRFEIVLEGTREEVAATASWQAYEFKGKLGNLRRLPPQVAPYHLRLDWLMWFAAMPSGRLAYPPWLLHLVGKLLEGDAATLALLKHNPFSEAPPNFVRALYYHYRFTTPEERLQSGCWWHRELVGTYLPPLSLEDPAFAEILDALKVLS